MSNLPPRPTFTNIGDVSPTFNTRRRNSSRHSGSPRNSPHPRHYHPYTHPTNTPTQHSPIPPWRVDQSRRRANHHLDWPRHQSPQASRTVGTPSGVPSSSNRGWQQSASREHPAVYVGAPVTYVSLNDTRSPTASDKMHDSGNPRGLSPMSMTSNTGQQTYTHPSGNNGSGWNTAGYHPAGSGYAAPASGTWQMLSSGPNQGYHWQPVSHGSPMSVGMAIADRAATTRADDAMSLTSSSKRVPGNSPSGNISMDHHENCAPAHIHLNPVSYHAGPFTMDNHTLLNRLFLAAEQPSHLANPHPETRPPQPTMHSINHDDEMMRDSGAAPIPTRPNPTTAPQHHHHRQQHRPAHPNPSIAGDDTVMKDSQTPGRSSAPSVATTTPTATPTPNSHNNNNSIPSLSPTATTRLTITLGDTTRTLLINPSTVRTFTAITFPPNNTIQPPAPNQNHAATSPEPMDLHLDLNTAIPRAATSAIISCASHLDALQALLLVLHDPETRGRDGLGVDELWRLGRMNGGLGIGCVYVEWLRKCMGVFVAETKSVGDGLRAVGKHMAGARWEKALGACEAFGWAEEWRAVAARLAYLCAVSEDAETGEVRLVRPDGEQVEVGICGGRAVNIIIAARRQVLPNLFTSAQSSLSSWTVRVGRRPCVNSLCTTNRIAAINVFLLQSGLFPRTKLDKSLHEIVAALHYITATEGQLLVAAAEREQDGLAGGDDNEESKLAWALKIRETYGGTCTKCDEKTATNMLFPLEDLLTDLTWELHDHLYEATEYPHAPLRPFGASTPQPRGD